MFILLSLLAPVYHRFSVNLKPRYMNVSVILAMPDIIFVFVRVVFRFLYVYGSSTLNDFLIIGCVSLIFLSRLLSEIWRWDLFSRLPRKNPNLIA